ncbi:hypothetical protein GQ43DRAFT_361114 [Delitschia confertaspora ATCC 74209]|uniref:SRR1-like domain-containing protein n=1 Tax=Delitschia confertaspora ATCC 74209 TaxID=1513339 RepID=A0A9P4JWW9_9PLEO|nr:hypothetical protein GQ43DRAFT_361114 [Delitschia confertaspora ATCC 74209]
MEVTAPKKKKTSRKAGAGPVKRVTVPLDDGWSMVTHTSSRNRSGLSDRSNNKITGEKEKRLLAASRPKSIVPGLTVQGLMEEFREFERRWRETSCKRGVEGLLKRRGFKEGDLKEAVCLGVGSFSVDWEHRGRSLWQLVLFLGVVREVSTPAIPLKLFAQEPCFNSIDKAFLRELGFAILNNDAHKHFTPTSFVYSPFLDWFILLPMLRNKDPTLFIGNEILADYSQYTHSLPVEKSIKDYNNTAKKFLRSRKAYALPSFDLHQHAMHGMMIYFKKSEGIDVEVTAIKRAQTHETVTSGTASAEPELEQQ